jgi:hypothetical protein
MFPIGSTLVVALVFAVVSLAGGAWCRTPVALSPFPPDEIHARF